jgi:hypothetical protein
MTAWQSFRILLVSLILPLLVTAAAVVLVFAWLPSVPNPIASHWNAEGVIDGFAAPVSVPITILAICLPLIAIFGGIALFGAHHTGFALGTKFVSVVSLGVPSLIAAGFAGTIADQRGIASAAEAPSPLPALAIGVGIGIVLAACGWFILPAASAGRSTTGEAHRAVALPLAPAERASWMRTTSARPGLLWGLAGVTVVVIASSTWAIVSSGGRLWALSLIPVVVMIAVFGTFTWTVRVDARGVRVRNSLGFPTFSIPLDDVASASAEQVGAVGEFGGWGIRFGGSHSMGIIVRSGDALRVNRRSGRSLVVTVDDAQSAAALLNGLVARG